MSITSRIAFTAVLVGAANLSLAAVSTASTPGLRSASVAESYSCSAVTPKGTFSYSGTATFKGTTPADAAVGTSVQITGFQATVVIPGSLLDEAYSYGVRSIATTVTAFAITSTDANPATLSVTKRPVKVGHTNLAPSGNPTLNANIPRRPAKVGSWVASHSGTMAFTPDSATLHLKTNLGSLDVNCSPSAQAVPFSSTTVN